MERHNTEQVQHVKEQFDALSALAHMMKSSRAIGFVGAGVSKHSGYPLWEELLGNLRKQLERREGRNAVTELDRKVSGRSDPRWIAEVYTEALATGVDREEAIGLALSSGLQSGPSQIHRLLARLPFQQFITTNYDRLIEQACDEEPGDGELPCKPFSAVKVDGFNGFLKSFSAETNRKSVLHLHGIVNEEVTLALSDYDEQYLGEGMLLRMYTIFATSSVVFLGTSLTDVDLMQMIRRAHWHGDRKTRHFAFLHESERQQAEALARSYGIRSIMYGRSDQPRDHSDLNRVLSHLLELTEALNTAGSRRPGGNRPPVVPDSGRQPWERDVDVVELLVKDRIRPPAEEVPVVFVRGLGEARAEHLLRRLAVDYRRIPKRFGFGSVIWLSPRRIGLFPTPAPGQEPPRSVVHGIFGEITRVLGEHRITATLDDALNQRQLASVLKEEKALLVLAGAAELYDSACRNPSCAPRTDHDCGKRQLGELLLSLPEGSVSLVAAAQPPWADDPTWRTFEEVGSASPREGDDAPADIDDAVRDGTTGDDRVLHRELLCALSILAAPVTKEELAARLHRSPVDLERAVAELADEKLLEFHRSTTSQPNRAPLLGPIDVTNPVRASMLKAAAHHPVVGESFRTTALRLETWAHRTITGLRHWQHDSEQYARVKQLLPDLLTVFEAGCSLSPLGTATEDHLSLGIELTRVLMRTGRWSEAIDFGRYLEEATRRSRSQQLLDVEVVRSRMLSLAHLADEDLANAERLGRRAERRPYASAIQRRQATLARAVAQFERGKREEARAAFKNVWRQSWREYERAPGDRELMSLAKEAAGRYVEAQLAEVSAGKADRRVLRSMLRVLDRRAELLRGLRSRRELGHNWRLRGSVLCAYGSMGSARRCFARALIVSYEFHDRRLEAQARLGIGQCEWDSSQIERARIGFVALRRNVEANDADRILQQMNLADATPGRGTPRLILTLGPRQSGKSTALEIATTYLGRTGFDPVDISAVFKEWPRDPERVHAAVQRAQEESGAERVLIAKVDEPNPLALIDQPEERRALRGSLLVHLQPVSRSGTVRTPWLLTDVPELPESVPPRGFVRWDSALEYSDISYVAIDSNVQILDLEREIQDTLSISYLPVDQLLETNRRSRSAD